MCDFSKIVTNPGSHPLFHKRSKKVQKGAWQSGKAPLETTSPTLRRFEALTKKEFSPVAQLVEQATVNRWVAGSSPAWGAILGSSD